MPAPTQNNTPGSGQRLLVIDDDRELCTLIHDYLSPLGYEIVAEHDGLRGIDRALAEEFQAVILVVMLP